VVWLLDPKEKIGTASLTARLMNEGTKPKTPVELRETMQDLGVTVSVGSSEESFSSPATVWRANSPMPWRWRKR